ncbi:MAG: synthase delta chain [Herbinix sp.]|jgi:F-type H+-transporting ATPase subunit delta|nr:synthase delta chain [Herbinix sp.]
MTKSAFHFAKVLLELNITDKCIQESKDMILANQELQDALSNPAVKKSEKHAVIDRIFAGEIRSFLKVISDRDAFFMAEQIFDAYESVLLQSKNMIKATFSFVTKPDSDQLIGIKEMLCTKFRKADVLLELQEDPSLIGGFVITVDNIVIDNSIKGSINNLYKTLVWR